MRYPAEVWKGVIEMKKGKIGIKEDFMNDKVTHDWGKAMKSKKRASSWRKAKV